MTKTRPPLAPGLGARVPSVRRAEACERPTGTTAEWACLTARKRSWANVRVPPGLKAGLRDSVAAYWLLPAGSKVVEEASSEADSRLRLANLSAGAVTSAVRLVKSRALCRIRGI